jgi:hypothetical protein
MRNHCQFRAVDCHRKYFDRTTHADGSHTTRAVVSSNSVKGYYADEKTAREHCKLKNYALEKDLSHNQWVRIQEPHTN